MSTTEMEVREQLGNTRTISEIRFRMLDQEKDGLLGFASCLLLGAFYLNDIAIRRGRNRDLYLTYPVTRSRSGSPHRVWNPINETGARLLNEAILGRLREMGR
ncbi:MAG: hypothetical protein ABIH26_08375 [Candidatus Eisenbacteria bacterium]